LQGRDITGAKNPDGPADPIIVHPDVRRNLMDQKSLRGRARAPSRFWGAHADRPQPPRGRRGGRGPDLAPHPVIKGFLTDKGFETTVLAQQTSGGSGFTKDWGLEQFVRDARIAMIYEGTNGVQSLDLVGRKLAMDGGKPIMAFFDMVKGFIKENEGDATARTGSLPRSSRRRRISRPLPCISCRGDEDPQQRAVAGPTTSCTSSGMSASG
jgi:hypothetical protein